MGGCCCCASKGSEVPNPPAYYYFPGVPEEHVPLSPHRGVSSTLATGLLVDTNLDTSIPEAYRPPPPPIPFDVVLGHPQTSQEISSVKQLEATDNDSLQQTVDDLKAESGLESVEDLKADISKPVNSLTEEEDVCPICLEEYDEENPKLITKCEHEFHLACIFEWMERSDTCAVCDQEMVFSPRID